MRQGVAARLGWGGAVGGDAGRLVLRILGTALLVGLLALPYAWVAWWTGERGFLANTTAALLTKAKTALALGRPEAVGFTYPPLGVLLAALAGDASRLAYLGAVLAAAAGARLIAHLRAEQRSRMAVVAVAAAVLYNPASLYLVVSDPALFLGLFLLYLAHRGYRRYLETGLTLPLMRCGLALALAFTATPLSIPTAALLGAALLGAAPARGCLWRATALAFVTLFPIAAASLSWLYLSWLFTGEPVWRAGFGLFAPKAPMGTVLLAPLYFLALSLQIAHRAPDLPGSLAVGLLALIPALRPGVGAVELALLAGWIAAAALPARLARPWALAVAGAAALQLASALALAPPEYRRWLEAMDRFAESERVERTLAARLAALPPGTVLADDRESYRLLARMPTLEPFLLPAHARFEQALSAPAAYVSYLLLRPGAPPDSPLVRFRSRPPPGFRLAVRTGGYVLYRRDDAPALPAPSP